MDRRRTAQDTQPGRPGGRGGPCRPIGCGTRRNPARRPDETPLLRQLLHAVEDLPADAPAQPVQSAQPVQATQATQATQAAVGASASNTMDAMQTGSVAAAQRRAELEQAVQCDAERENEA